MLVAPSILSADWSRLEAAVRLAEAGADWIHCDVMDGHFVPNLTFGPDFVAALRRLTDMPLDVHHMIDDPKRYLADFARAGANLLTIHVEAPGVAGPGWPPPTGRNGGPASNPSTASRSAHRIDTATLSVSIAAVRETGARVGLALRPDTALEEVEPVLGEIDVLLVMTVYPGFSGQRFLEDQLVKVRAAADWKRARGARYQIEIDGGVNVEDTGPRVAQAGAEVLVAGHGVYRSPDPVAAMQTLRGLS